MSEERISRLEETVKHLIQHTFDVSTYADHESKMSMEEFAKREDVHKKAYQKFLEWMAG